MGKYAAVVERNGLVRPGRIQSVFRASKIRRSRGLPSGLHSQTSDLFFRRLACSGGRHAYDTGSLPGPAVQVVDPFLLPPCLLSAARGPWLVGPATSPHSPIPASQAPVETGGQSGEFAFFCPLPAAEGSCRTSSSINQLSCAEPPTTLLMGRVGRGSRRLAFRW